MRFLIFVALLSGAITASIGTAFFITRTEMAPLTYENMPFPVETPIVIAGGQLTITVVRCNHTDGPIAYHFSRTFREVDRNIIITLKPSDATGTFVMGPSGCETVHSNLHVIPEDFPPGRYVLEGTVSTDGRFAGHLSAFSTQPFLVVKR